MRQILAATFFVLVSVGSGAAQYQNIIWLSDLNFQLEDEKQCEPAYYIWVRENDLGAILSHEARVQCVDGRQFDATRMSADDKFDIKECQIEVC